MARMWTPHRATEALLPKAVTLNYRQLRAQLMEQYPG
jgi:hypothetical protein